MFIRQRAVSVVCESGVLGEVWVEIIIWDKITKGVNKNRKEKGTKG